MIHQNPWDDIDAVLLGLAQDRPKLTELIDQSGLGADLVKSLVYGYVQTGALTQAPFTDRYELTVTGWGRLRQLETPLLAKAA